MNLNDERNNNVRLEKNKREKRHFSWFLILVVNCSFDYSRTLYIYVYLYLKFIQNQQFNATLSVSEERRTVPWMSAERINSFNKWNLKKIRPIIFIRFWLLHGRTITNGAPSERLFTLWLACKTYDINMVGVCNPRTEHWIVCFFSPFILFFFYHCAVRRSTIKYLLRSLVRFFFLHHFICRG